MPPKRTAKKAVKKDYGKKEIAPITNNRAEVASFINSLKKQGIYGNLEKKLDFISTGSFLINRAIGDGTHTDAPGGYPKGYITELFGDESCGKTTLAMHAVLQVQRNKGTVVYADFEHSLRAQLNYIKNLGVDLNPPGFIYMEPKSFEEGSHAIGKALITLNPDLIVIDTLTAMLPKANYEADADLDVQIGKHAKLTSSFLSWITKYLEQRNCALLLLNQIRSNIKQSQYDTGPTEITSGGKAPRFYSILRIQLKAGRKEQIAQVNKVTGVDEKKAINHEIKVSIVKNKLDIPFKSVPIYIAFGQGIDNIRSIMAAAEARKIIKQSAGWITWDDPAGRFNIKVQGRPNFKKYLEEHPDALEALSEYVIPSVDYSDMKKVKQELQSRDFDSLTEDEKETLQKLESSGVEEMELDDGPGENDDALADLSKFSEELHKIGKNPEEPED